MKGLASSKTRVNTFYTQHPEYRIIHDNLSDMSQVTSSQTYQKGSWILHMLRGMLGEEVFWKGIQSYYKKYMNLNATTSDFKREMEEASGKDLKVFFEQWLYKPGALTLNGTWQYNAKKKDVTLQLKQTQTDGSIFNMPLQVAITSAKDKQSIIKTIQITGKSNEYSFSVEGEPENIVLDPNSWLLMEATLTKK
jgi:aminopeptidase N